MALTVSGNEKWASFCKAIDKDDLGSDPRFFDINSRFENRLALDEIISKILGEVDAASFTRRLRGFGIPCEIVLNTREVVLNSDFHKMGLFKKVKHDASGTFDHVVPAWELSQTPATIDLPAPTLGRHTKSVLSDILPMKKNKKLNRKEYFNFISDLKKQSIINLDTVLIKEFVMPANE